MNGAISHSVFALRDPDWFALSLLPSPQCAEALQSILVSLDGAEEKIFAKRGLALLMFEERQLYREFIDPEFGVSFASMDRWLKLTLPKSWRYCTEAKSTIKAVRDEIQPRDIADIPRCNLHQLKQVSSSVRTLPEVVQAAKSMPEKQFVEKLNREHSQHLECKVPVVMAPASVNTIFEQAIDRVIVYYGCTRAEAFEVIGKDILNLYPVESNEAMA